MATRYVNADSSGAAGNPTRPFDDPSYTPNDSYATFSAAYTAASPGDTIELSGGTNGKSYLGHTTYLSKDNITIQGSTKANHNGTATVDYSGTSAYTMGIYAVGVTIKNLTVSQTTGATATGMIVYKNNCTLSGVTFISCKRQALNVQTVITGTVITNCIFIGNRFLTGYNLININSPTTINNSIFSNVNSTNSLYIAAGITATCNNCIFACGGVYSFAPLSVAGTLNTNNCFIQGTLDAPRTYKTGAGTWNSSNDIIDAYPYWLNRTGYLTLHCDDGANIQYFATNARYAMSNYGISMSMFVSSTNSLSPIDISTLQALYKEGHEIGVHTRDHNDLSILNALTITYSGANSNMAAVVSSDGTTLTITGLSDTHGPIDLTGTSYNTLSKLATLISGWANFACSITSPHTSVVTPSSCLKSATVSLPRNTAAYMLFDDDTSANNRYYTHEIAGAISDLTAALRQDPDCSGYTPKSLAWPFNLAATAAVTWVKKYTNLLGTRTWSDTNGDSFPFEGINVYNCFMPGSVNIRGGSDYTSMTSDQQKDAIQQAARVMATFAGGRRALYLLFHTTTELTAQEFTWLVDELQKYRSETLQIGTMGNFLTQVRTSGAWTDSGTATPAGELYTRTFGVEDFRPTNQSPLVNAGVTVSGRTTDIVGNSIVGVPDIGPYERIQRYWNPIGLSTDINSGANYTGSGNLLATDDLVFDGSQSVADAALTANLAVNSVSVTTGHSGAFSLVGYTLTVAASSTINGGGTRNLGNGIRLAGNNISFSRASTSMTTSSCVIRSSGTGNAFVDNSDGSSGRYSSIIIDDNCDLSFIGCGSSNVYAFQKAGNIIAAGVNSTFTNTAAQMYLYNDSNSPFISFAASSQWVRNSAVCFRTNGNGLTCTIPAFTTSGSGSLAVRGNVTGLGSSTVQLTGNLNISTAALQQTYSPSSGAVTDFTFDANGYNITCGTIQVGAASAYGVCNLLLKNGTITCTGYDASTYNSGTTNENWGSATVNCSGSVSFGSTHVITPGTATLNITNISTITAGTPATQLLPSININASGKAVTLGSDICCTGYTVTAGTALWGAYGVAVGQAIRNWSSSGSTDVSNFANYTGAGAILTTDILYYSSTSVINAIATANLSCGSVLVGTAFTGTWSINGQVLTVTRLSSIGSNGSAVRNLGNGITLNGSSITFTVANASMSTTNCTIRSSGTGNSFVDNRSGPAYLNVIVDASCGLALASGSSSFRITGACPVVTLGNSATLSHNSSLVISPINSGNILSLGTATTWNGSGSVYFNAYTDGTICYLPAFGYAGGGSVAITNGNVGMGASGASIMLSGNLNTNGNNFIIQNAVAKAFTVDTCSCGITCGEFRAGSSAASAVLSLYYRNSTINCTSVTATYNSGTTYRYYGSAIIICSGNFIIGSTHVLDRGSSTLRLTNTASVNLGNQSLWGLIINAPGKTITAASNITAHFALVINGTLSMGTYALSQEYSTLQLAVL